MADLWGVATGYGDPSENDFANPENLFASDNAHATSSTQGDEQDLDGFSWPLFNPSGQYAVLEAVHGEIEAKTTRISGLGRCTLGLALSVDGGISWTSYYNAIWAFADGEITQEVNLPLTSDRKIWGEYITLAQLVDTSLFRVRLKVVKLDATTTVWVDRVRIGIDYHFAAHVGGTGHFTDDTEIVIAQNCGG